MSQQNIPTTKTEPCENCEQKPGRHFVGCPVGQLQLEEHLEHVPCVLTHYNLTDDEWDATPENLKMALLLECAARK